MIEEGIGKKGKEREGRRPLKPISSSCGKTQLKLLHNKEISGI